MVSVPEDAWMGCFGHIYFQVMGSLGGVWNGLDSFLWFWLGFTGMQSGWFWYIFLLLLSCVLLLSLAMSFLGWMLVGWII